MVVDCGRERKRDGERQRERAATARPNFRHDSGVFDRFAQTIPWSSHTYTHTHTYAGWRVPHPNGGNIIVSQLILLTCIHVHPFPTPPLNPLPTSTISTPTISHTKSTINIFNCKFLLFLLVNTPLFVRTK